LNIHTSAYCVNALIFWESSLFYILIDLFLLQGLHRLGKTDVPVYDGSWTEWGAHPDTPVDTTKKTQ